VRGKDAQEALGEIPYLKGALFLDTLRTELGAKILAGDCSLYLAECGKTRRLARFRAIDRGGKRPRPRAIVRSGLDESLRIPTRQLQISTISCAKPLALEDNEGRKESRRFRTNRRYSHARREPTRSANALRGRSPPNTDHAAFCGRFCRPAFSGFHPGIPRTLALSLHPASFCNKPGPLLP